MLKCISFNLFTDLISNFHLSFFDIQSDVAEYCETKFSQLVDERRMAIELNNGRAAQMGILALMVHEKLDNNPYILNSMLGAPVAFN